MGGEFEGAASALNRPPWLRTPQENAAIQTAMGDLSTVYGQFGAEQRLATMAGLNNNPQQFNTYVQQIIGEVQRMNRIYQGGIAELWRALAEQNNAVERLDARSRNRPAH